ncbi:cupin domain-containing protein [Pseudonocardia endophytica]|uniref:Cupin domain n=1 Tax=Pseudonocardia endophytica TaxID=401976 RepID=A0A4R1I2C9_PSEEN|nr:cupin domain-containing protein [Pseudonocardia endophytica]TCK27440.1 cupin domain [Pseudonocardia endophytica]
MEVTRPVVRTAVLALVVTAFAAGCARPGELGHEDDAPPPPRPPAAAAPEPAPPVPVAAAGSDARGTLDAPVEIRTPGPAEFLVRTETLAPGQSSGWITHPGAVISVVRSGTVTVVQRDACTPAPVAPERSFYVADATPYEMRNDGPDPVVLTRSELLAPGAEERRPADPAC